MRVTSEHEFQLYSEGDMTAEVARRYFNVDEYYRMAEAGILSADDHVELIEGEIVRMIPVNPPHAGCVDRLNDFLGQHLNRRAIVRVQSPIRLHDLSEPEPDLALLRPRSDFYSRSHPTAEDVFLLVEISDSTSKYDRDVKLPVYARAGISEVWIINLGKEIVETYFQPVNGRYTKTQKAGRGKSVAVMSFPDIMVSVDIILGDSGV